MTPADPARCTILEIGCGDGANLIPVGYSFPQTRCVGIDLASTAIEHGRSNVRSLGLANVELRVADLAALPDDLGEFDFVIAHGVYSWVPENARRALLAACRRHLAPQGIAYVSYNVYPGGHLRLMLREMVRMHGEELDDPARLCAAAREFLDLVVQAGEGVPADTPRRILTREAQEMAKRSDPGIIHDDLSPVFHLCYFRDFCDEAESHGLQFLSETDFFEMGDHGFAPAVRHSLARFAPDLISREQYLDFLKVRRFRQTLLCRSGLPLESELRAERVWGLPVSCLAQAEDPAVDPASAAEQRYSVRGAITFSSREPVVKQALHVMAREWPRAFVPDDLLKSCAEGLGRKAGLRDREILAAFLANGYATGVVELHAAQAAFSRRPGSRPRASALAGIQAKSGEMVVNLLGRLVALDDPVARDLLARLDGARDRKALVEEIRRHPDALAALASSAGGDADEAALASALDRSLETLGLCGLLHADPDSRPALSPPRPA
jgi:SAM-dependent methyltransferase